jgi:hypothetical protein
VTVFAVTGHMDLSDESVPLVRAELLRVLAEAAARGPVTGLSCVARGADSLFAEAVLQVGGELVAVLPSEDYRQAEVEPEDAELFDQLVAEAAELIVLPFATAGRGAYEAANALLLERAEVLVAVWDGQPPTGKGGTGDLVERARAAGVPVWRVWPEGCSRRG